MGLDALGAISLRFKESRWLVEFDGVGQTRHARALLHAHIEANDSLNVRFRPKRTQASHELGPARTDAKSRFRQTALEACLRLLQPTRRQWPAIPTRTRA